MNALPRALLSIHDVMPETLDDVARLFDHCLARDLPPPALLVVPGREWRETDLRRLHEWRACGAELIAHGWLHRTRPRRPYHRLHAAFFSRDVAEHLALPTDGVLDLMRASHDWFAEHDLPSPQTYIPPAWALGVAPHRVLDLPYRCIEVLRGVLLRDDNGMRSQHLPLLGFEADTPLRAMILRQWNGIQRQRAVRAKKPLRISIHPADHRLLLQKELDATLGQNWHCLRYGDLVPA
jgi:predicted deacetylase